MIKEQEGIVIELGNKTAKIKVARHGDCENCGACAGDNAMVLEVNNTLGAKKGDRVIFVAKENGMLKAAFIVYLLPLISIFIGAQLGLLLSRATNGSNTIFQVIGGILAFSLSMIFIIYYEKTSKSDIRKLPTIVRIL